MTMHVYLPIPCDYVVVDGQVLARIHIARANLKEWCLALQLLQDELIKAVSIECPITQQRMQISRDVENTVTCSGPSSSLKVTFDGNALNYARHFFLRYYRDGTAEVDHIDIETRFGGYITLAVEEFAPSLSPGEARKRLGI